MRVEAEIDKGHSRVEQDSYPSYYLQILLCFTQLRIPVPVNGS